MLQPHFASGALIEQWPRILWRRREKPVDKLGDSLKLEQRRQRWDGSNRHADEMNGAMKRRNKSGNREQQRVEVTGDMLQGRPTTKATAKAFHRKGREGRKLREFGN